MIELQKLYNLYYGEETSEKDSKDDESAYWKKVFYPVKSKSKMNLEEELMVTEIKEE